MEYTDEELASAFEEEATKDATEIVVVVTHFT
jgi:hypothetical protein